MLIGRHSFIRQNKLSDVAGRIDYISNPKRQEHLYATYQTEGATSEFWKNLARENQLDFKASGTAGKCIEGREFIIALPESFVEYKADDVVRLFTDSFHKRYGVECSAAFHHNKRMTNYHIHLVFSERKMLEHPEVKIAIRNDSEKLWNGYCCFYTIWYSLFLVYEFVWNNTKNAYFS